MVIEPVFEPLEVHLELHVVVIRLVKILINRPGEIVHLIALARPDLHHNIDQVDYHLQPLVVEKLRLDPKLQEIELLAVNFPA